MSAPILESRRIIVTGGGSGIGAATAALAREQGAQVFRVDIAGEAELLIDVTGAQASEQIVAAATAAMGGLDSVVACAGVVQGNALEDFEDAMWDRTLAINVTAPFKLVRAAIPALRESGRGRVVLIGSVMSSFGAPGLVAYAASKHAVLGMTKAMASELGVHGITVNCVQPGAIETPMTAGAFSSDPAFAEFWRNKAALKRLGQPGDIASAIAFLLSDGAAFISGHGIFVDGAAMSAP
jgi:3-oxoacyl-[acyl-carrier protein] reductase